MTLFLSEHRAQPEVYKHYSVALMWTIVKCVQDPGDMAPRKPLTIIGKISAFFVGTLNVAIFAIPAGLISSGFVDAMEEEKHEIQLCENIERLHHSMRWMKDPAGYYSIPAYVPMDNIITKQFMSSEEIIEAVQRSKEFHLYNLAKAYNQEDAISDRIVVVSCPINRPYGYCIDRGSAVTIVSTSGYDEPITSWFAYHVAKFGGFNYVAKEVEMDPDNPQSYFSFDDSDIDENLQMFIDDIDKLSSREDSWVIPMAFCIGPKSRPHKFHICYSSSKGDSGFSDPHVTLSDSIKFEALYSDLERVLKDTYGLECDKNLYYPVNKNNLCSKLNCDNAFFFRAECHVAYFSSQKLAIIKSVADLINANLENDRHVDIPEEMKTKSKTKFFGYRGYRDYTFSQQ